MVWCGVKRLLYLVKPLDMRLLHKEPRTVQTQAGKGMKKRALVTIDLNDTININRELRIVMQTYTVLWESKLHA